MNLLDVFKKKKQPPAKGRGIWVRLTLDGYLLGAYTSPHGTPVINVQDMTQQQYAEDFAGGRINFRQTPTAWHRELELGSGTLTLQTRDLRQFVERP